MAKYEVCPTCDGDGKIPLRSISPRGDGSWTSSELAELRDEDPEFYDEYFHKGIHQQNCPECNGQRVVPGSDYDYGECANNQDLEEGEKEHEKAIGYLKSPWSGNKGPWCEKCMKELCYAIAEVAAERRMGA